MQHALRAVPPGLVLLVLGMPVSACGLGHADTRLMVGPPPGVTLDRDESLRPETSAATVMDSAESDLPRGVILVEPARVLQAVRGFGGEAGFQLLGPPGRADGVTRADYDHVIAECAANGVTWARVGVPAWEDLNDDGDPATANRERFDEEFDRHFPGLVPHLASLRQAGIEPLLALEGFPGWMYGSDTRLKPGILPELVENCAVLLGMLREKGVPVRWFSMFDELPSGEGTSDPETLAEAVRLLGVRLAEMKLDIRIVAPEISGDLRRRAMDWVEPLLAKAAPYVESVSFHDYRFSRDERPEDIAPLHAALGRQIVNRGAGGRTPEIWYTEYNGDWFGNADEDRRGEGGPCDSWAHGMKVAELTHYLLASGVSLALIRDLYDVRREVGDREPGRWGTIKYKTEGWAKRPEYYTLGAYSRFIRPGYRIVGCRGSRAGAPLAIAALGPGYLVVVLNNPRRVPDAADIAIGVEPAGAAAEVWLTTRQAPFSLSFRPIRAGRIYVDLPPMGLATVRVPCKH